MTDIALGQTISGTLSSANPSDKYISTDFFGNSSTVDRYYDQYILSNVPSFDQIEFTLSSDSVPLSGTHLSIYDLATFKVVADTYISISGSTTAINKPAILDQTTYPGISYGIQISELVPVGSSVVPSGSYQLSVKDLGQATSIVSTYYGDGVGTVNAVGKYSALAKGKRTLDLNDVARSPSGLFYGIKSSYTTLNADQLWVVDPSSSDGSQIRDGANLKDTAGNNLFESLSSLAFSSDNQLYAIGRSAAGVSELYQIDINTKVATLISTLPAGLNIFGVSLPTNTGDLVYDAANNRFLVSANSSTSVSNDNALWQIPLANPAGATKIGNIGFNRVVGLSFENGQLVGIIGDSNFGPQGKVIINTSTGIGQLDPAFSTSNSVTYTGATSILPLTIPTRNDFNGDGKSDILWRNDYGSVAVWQMNGATVTSSSLTSVPNIDASWKVAGTGDFNGDGKSDVLWRNTNGSVDVWTMNGSTVVSSNLTSTPSLDNSWKTVGTGDYNGDGKADILWRNDNGSIAVWTMNGFTVVSSSLTSTPKLDTSWKVAGNSDFDGDGKADILWRNDNGSVALWQMNGAGVSASTAVAKVSADWKIAGTGDFNGDGKADILWRNDDGSVALWQMNGAAITSTSRTSTPSLDSSWTIAGIGDYNGDGKADISWRNTSGAVDIWQMNGSTVVSSTLTSVAADGSNWKIAAPIL
jgi:FG-GAP-like repeat